MKSLRSGRPREDECRRPGRGPAHLDAGRLQRLLLFGGGLGSMAVGAWGYDGAYALAGCVSMVVAAIALLLRQPGRTGGASVPAARPRTAS